MLPDYTHYMLLPDCTHFSCYFPIASSCNHAHTVQSIKCTKIVTSLEPPPECPTSIMQSYTRAHTHTHIHAHNPNVLTRYLHLVQCCSFRVWGWTCSSWRKSRRLRVKLQFALLYSSFKDWAGMIVSASVQLEQDCHNHPLFETVLPHHWVALIGMPVLTPVFPVWYGGFGC